MIAYPEPTMPRSTRHLAERAERLREPGASQPPSPERVAAITRSIRHIADHVRALRAATSK
ncbi:MAG TPA: hypothetical protein VIU64_17480 [Polyangia bacterium]